MEAGTLVNTTSQPGDTVNFGICTDGQIGITITDIENNIVWSGAIPASSWDYSVQQLNEARVQLAQNPSYFTGTI